MPAPSAPTPPAPGAAGQTGAAWLFRIPSGRLLAARQDPERIGVGLASVDHTRWVLDQAPAAAEKAES